MKAKLAGALTLGIVAALALAACGSSSKATVSPNAQPSVTAPAPSTGSGAQAVVKAATVGTVGSVLVDDTGLTLYTLTNNGQPVACTGPCAALWPPLTLPAGTTTAAGGAGVTGLGTTKSANGVQVTANGDPLYRYSKDGGPGDAKGEGLSGFGGTWHVVMAAGAATEPTVAPATTPATPAPTTPTTMSSYGYGGGY
jgi:predicted lipoprotein with Yx(FWY)xxD motif